MSLLQKSPRALLAALELKVSGDNPTVFGDSVVPVIDVYDQYLIDRALMATGSTAITQPATSGSVVLTPPAGEAWRVRSIGAIVNVDAADVAIDKQLFIAIRDAAGSSSVIVAAESSLAFASLFGGIYLDRPLWLPAGWTINTFGALASAPTVDWAVSVRAMYERIIE